MQRTWICHALITAHQLSFSASYAWLAISFADGQKDKHRPSKTKTPPPSPEAEGEEPGARSTGRKPAFGH